MEDTKKIKKPLVSIITGTYNSAIFVADCVKSVHMQSYQNIEHVIIDGASKDDTLTVIKQTPNRIGQIVSERDDGIYDAMNKGLKTANGDILGILNSDDFYNSDNVISEVVDAFKDPAIDCVYGDLLYVDQENTDKVVRKWVTGPYKTKCFQKGWHPAHPSFFVRKSVYEKYGYFNLSLDLAADFEIMLRFMEKHKIKGSYLPFPMVRMRLGGATNKSIKNIIKGNKECLASFRMNKIKVSGLYPLIRLLPKVKQFF